MIAEVLKGLEGNGKKNEKHNQPARHQLITQAVIKFECINDKLGEEVKILSK